MRYLWAILLLAGAALGQGPITVPVSTSTGVVVGSGYIKSENRQIVRTVGNVVYIFAIDDSPCLATSSPTRGLLRAYKGSGSQALNANVPTAFAEVDAAHHPLATGSGTCQFDANVTNVIFSPDVRMDAAGLVHLAYIKPNSQTGAATLYYNTFNTSTDLWGTEASMAVNAAACGGPFGGWPRWSNVALTLDASDHPYILYATNYTCGTSGTNQINWMAKTASGGTAWTAAAAITGSSGTQELYPAVITALDGSLHAIWVDSALQAHANIKWAKFSAGAWGTVETVASSVLAATDDDGTANVAVDANSLPHVVYMVGTAQTSPCSSGCDNYNRERYRTAGGVWTDNTPVDATGGLPSGTGTWPTGGVGHSPSNYVSSIGEVFDFLGHDTVKSPAVFTYQIGVGTTWTAQNQTDPCNATTSPNGEPGCDGAVTIRYDPLRENNSSIIDLAYYKEDDGTAGYNHHGTIWYKGLQIATSATYPQTANLWVDTNGGTCTRQTTAGVWVDDQACSSLQVAQTAASAGDRVIVKNGTYGSQTLSSAEKTTSPVLYYGETYQQALLGGFNLSIGNVELHGISTTGGFNTHPDISFMYTSARPVVIDGMAARTTTIGNAPSVRVSNLTIENADLCNGTPGTSFEEDCIHVNAGTDGLTLKNNNLHDWFSTSGNDTTFHNDFIQLFMGSGVLATNVTIDGNIFANGPFGSSNIQVGGGLMSNFTIQNNYLGVNKSCGNNFTYGQGSTSGFVRYRNNVIANTCGFLVVNDGGASGAYTLDASGNIFVVSVAGCSVVQSVSGGFNVHIPSGGITCGSNAKRCTPNWLNGAPSSSNGYDIRLNSADTCAKDAGNPSSFAPTDFYGTTRPQGSAPDAGAFEILAGITTFTLTVSKTGTGTGLVTGGAINCGATCTDTENSGTVITLTASALGGSTFTGWSGGGCTGIGSCAVTLNADTTVSPNFDLIPVHPRTGGGISISGGVEIH